MPIKPTFPGVYIEEIPSGVHTITGVATSITAFLGVTDRGPVDRATQIFSPGDYERSFGSLSVNSPLSYAVSQFFLNGGTEAYVIRLLKDAKQGFIVLNDDAGNPLLAVQALDAGTEGNNIQVLVDYNTIDPNNFNITFIYASKDHPGDTRVETFKNVSLNKGSDRYIDDMINDVSQLVTVTEDTATLNELTSELSAAAASAGGTSPAGAGGSASGAGTASGSAGGAGSGGSATTAVTTTGPKRPAALAVTGGSLTSGPFADTALDALPSDAANALQISIDGGTPNSITLDSSTASGSDIGAKLADVAARIQGRVRSLNRLPAYSDFTCTADQTNKKLILTSGTIGQSSSVAVTAASSNDIASSLNLLTGTTPQPSSNPVLKKGAGVSFTPDDPQAFSLFTGDPVARTGVYALEEVDLFNLLCLPGITDGGILTEVLKYCQQRRAFLIVDAPPDPTDALGQRALDPNTMVKTITGSTFLPKADLGTYAAVYYPWVKMPDPLKGGKSTLYPPSGIIAGLYARTDTNRGVWKAPAGTEANLVGVQGVNYLLTDDENGLLNPHGVNCLRVFPIYGPVCWGARTVSGDDDIASEYKYIPIRRLALYIEESLYRGTKWVVFEPNDEPLWAQIRLNVGAFMHNLFVKGAFQGQTPKEAYFVKCDKETTTQNDRDLGIVNIVVGFAPLKPAEFVIIQLQQIAGDIQV